MGMGGFGGMGGIGMLLFWGLVIALVAWGIRALSASTGSADSAAARSALLQILEQRFARGEIDRSEFEGKRRDLNG